MNYSDGKNRRMQMVKRDMTVRLLRPRGSNPRRPGTHGYRSWEIIEEAGGEMSYGDYRDAGGRARDLLWDRHRRWAWAGYPQGVDG